MRCIKKEYVESSSNLYDLEIEGGGHNYVANGLVVHNTLMQIGIVPTTLSNEKYYKGRVTLSSKGMGAKGWVLDHNDETNLYAQAAIKHGLMDKMLEAFGHYADTTGLPFFLVGEVFGKTLSGAGIQDLTYSDVSLDFRAFDMCMGNRGKETYFNYSEFTKCCSALDIPMVPVVYVGPYSKAVVLEHTDGNTMLTDKKQIREGVVVKSMWEIKHKHYGRKIAKSVSSAYLLRKGDTTEFQ